MSDKRPFNKRFFEVNQARKKSYRRFLYFISLILTLFRPLLDVPQSASYKWQSRRYTLACGFEILRAHGAKHQVRSTRKSVLSFLQVSENCCVVVLVGNICGRSSTWSGSTTTAGKSLWKPPRRPFKNWRVCRSFCSKWQNRLGTEDKVLPEDRHSGGGQGAHKVHQRRKRVRPGAGVVQRCNGG